MSLRLLRKLIRGRRKAPTTPKTPITRREYYERAAVHWGVRGRYVPDILAAVADSHPEWDMNTLVDPDTGEPIKRGPAPTGP